MDAAFNSLRNSNTLTTNRSCELATLVLGAILNHSCSPNCVLVYERLEEGEEMLQKIVAIEEVKEGEELFHSYVELCQPTSERREHLNESYGFMCNCERCISEGTDNLDSKYSEILKSEYPNVKSIIEDSLASAEELMYSEDESGGTERKEYELILKALNLQREYLGELHLSRYKSEALALSHSMLLASVPDAIEHCEVRNCEERSLLAGNAVIPFIIRLR